MIYEAYVRKIMKMEELWIHKLCDLRGWEYEEYKKYANTKETLEGMEIDELKLYMESLQLLIDDIDEDPEYYNGLLDKAIEEGLI